MIVIDSSGWMEYLAGSDHGKKLIPFVERSEELIVPSVTIYEVFKKVTLERDEEEALRAVGLMSSGTIVDLTRDLAIESALISIEHKLPMADSIIYATAREYDAELYTLDAHFKGLPGVAWMEK